MTKSAPRFIRLPAADRRLALIEAAVACMAEGGITAFTVDRICVRAGVSRGLITHHFGGMAGLLTATYAHLYETFLSHVPDLPAGPDKLMALIDAFFDPAQFNRATLHTWLAMWGAIANSAELTAEHRTRYAAYRDTLAGAIAAVAEAKGRSVDATALAVSVICLVDGLAIQHCIDPASLSSDQARQLCIDHLTLGLGPF